MIKKIIRKLLSNRFIYKIAKDAHESYRIESSLTINYEVPEITPFNFVKSEFSGKRINLLIPALSEKHVFGGISTALRFFDKVRLDFPIARIIVTDEVSVELKENQFYSDWKLNDLSADDINSNSIVVSGNRSCASIAISENDYFVTTAWWTTYNAFKMIEWQSAIFNIYERKLIYFVQDYEPGFYPWSTRYALAESTYLNSKATIPVFNTKLLSDFFIKNGYFYPQSYYFEPIINPVLSAARDQRKNECRERKILIYGRPGVERNLFNLIVQSISIWAELYPKAKYWKVFSAGEKHPDIILSHKVTINSLGKLNLDEYVHQLSTSSIGISLMLSPHPSYPPLEMASFGMKVITNSYSNKKLSKLSSNIVEPENLTPEKIANLLSQLCDVFEEKHEVIYEENLFSSSGIEFSFINDIT
ncbi:hypothetical protein V2A85_22740, partial [Yersinia sp. 1252 StPb PI]|uniref:rhamnosyltransferase WsaF family glycosyltransferase n=1 Tax=Yersinia sp. 1252 StPb PI TaxID=3117404 RepID=UPI003B27D5B7